MTDVQARLTEAIELHQAGELPAAEPLYREVLQAVPHHAEAMYLLGTLELQQGRFESSIELLSEVRSAQPDAPEVHNNLGIAYKAAGRLDEALSAFQTAIRRRPDYADAHFNLAAVLELQNHLPEAAHCYAHAQELDGKDPQTQRRLAGILQQLRDWDAAESCYRWLVEQDDSDVDAAVSLGFVLTQQQKWPEAETVFHGVLAHQPSFPEMHNNLSFVYEQQGRLEQALQEADQAIQLRGNYVDGYNNRGNALRSLHRLEEACESFTHALQFEPDFALARLNLATTRLLAGDFDRGWADYEARQIVAGNAPEFPQPRWEGSPLVGKTLLVHADEGLGDTIQFSRYLPMVKSASSARVVLQCQQKLHPLLTLLPGVDELVGEEGFVPAADAEVPLLSLPGLFGTHLENIPVEIPYLRAPAGTHPPWKQLIDSTEDAFLVGIVWQGNPLHPLNGVRSCPLSFFQPLTQIPGVQLVSLQTGETGMRQLAESPFRESVIDAESVNGGFADTATLIERLGLVISVDTSIAHLAGALGVPVWTVLSHTPEWRWLLDRDDSPWYPTMRLFRQPTWGDWPAVFERVGRELTALVLKRGAAS